MLPWMCLKLKETKCFIVNFEQIQFNIQYTHTCSKSIVETLGKDVKY